MDVNFQSCVGSSVEFLDLETEGAKWEAMPSLRSPRSCSPKVIEVIG